MFLDLSQFVGLLASTFIIFGFYLKNDLRLKTVLCAGMFIFSVHFLMIGEITAAAVNIINLFRIALSIKFHGSKSFFAIFVSIYIFIGFLTYEEWVNIFPLTASLLGTFGMYFLAGIKLRLLEAVGATSWLIHNTIVFSIGGIVTELFVLAMLVTGIYRLAMDKRNTHEAHS